MNIETANRLVQLRKKCGYSQEQLAEKLGLSRQSVSKWERAEASPDTDNLIELSKLYGVSLDDLLNCDKNLDDVLDKANKNEMNPEDDGTDASIRISTVEEEIAVQGDDVKVTHHSPLKKAEIITTSILTVVFITGYLLFGFLYSDHSFAWRTGWVFLLIPCIVSSVFECIEKGKISSFSFPLLIVGVYCFCGLGWGLWHPYWVMFLSIPLFYAITGSSLVKVSVDKSESSDE